MRILIRVDAYPDIAMGHLNRCINLGISLRDCGHNVTFVSYNDFTSEEVLSRVNFEYELIPFKINNKKTIYEELSQLSRLLETEDMLIVDS